MHGSFLTRQHLVAELSKTGAFDTSSLIENPSIKKELLLRVMQYGVCSVPSVSYHIV